MSRSFFFRLTALPAIVAAAFACGGSDTSAPSVDADGDAGVIVPTGCDLAKDPKDSPACIDDSVGLFVDAASGLDANPGTKAAPLKSITAAIAKAGNKPRIHVCAGSYPEHVKIQTPVSLFGGFECASWAPGSAAVKVAPADPGFALEIAGVQSEVAVVDLSFEAPAGTKESPSSVAVFVHESRARFSRISAVAKDGRTADNATVAPPNFDPALVSSSPLLLGKQGNGTAGGAPQECLGLCANGEHAYGGRGGNGTNSPTAGEAGKPNRGGGLGGVASVCNQTLQNGGTGVPGDDGTPAKALGTVGPRAWDTAPGETGKAGGPGQGGGGGGGGSDPSFGGGGGGGCGGCGGSGGLPPAGGGASIASVIVDSTVTFSAAALGSGAAGNGGEGAGGSTGQVGGAGGTQSTGGCQGGKGGAGGNGGASSGGAGGLSAAIVFKGTKPTVTASTLTPGTKGLGGKGGKPGVNDGPDGQATDLFEAK